MNEIDKQLIALARNEDLEEAKKRKNVCDSEYVTMGNPAADIAFFNMRARTDGEPTADEAESSAATDAGETAGDALAEAAAKPEADLRKAYNDAVKCAKVYNKPVIYGYMGSDHHGSNRYFAFDDPIVCDDLEKETANVMSKYHPSGSVLVAYPSQPILESARLDEAKRYVRRYYIKPHNIFCSNKTEVLKALIEHENEDCVIYTLLNLGDEKDVMKLTSDDVIYYYEDLVLYDKNHVRIMDYDLAIKKEEEREKINPDKVSDEKLADVYSDRMTELTELDESDKASWNRRIRTAKSHSATSLKEGMVFDIEKALHTPGTWGVEIVGEDCYCYETEEEAREAFNDMKLEDISEDCEGIELFRVLDKKGTTETIEAKTVYDEAFNQDFAGAKSRGKSLHEAKDGVCCICGDEIDGYGNNAEPYAHGRCCDACNWRFVIPARLERLKNDSNEELKEAVAKYSEVKDFASIEQKEEFNRKWIKTLNDGSASGLESCKDKTITVHKFISGREQKNPQTYRISRFSIGRNSKDILIACRFGYNNELWYKLNAFFGRIIEGGQDYLLTTTDNYLQKRINIYKETRDEAIKGYKNKAAKTIAELTPEEVDEAKDWLLRHIKRIDFKIPCGDEGYVKETEERVSGKAFKKYADKFFNIQRYFEDNYPGASGMKIGESREIGKDVFVKYIDVIDLPQSKLSHYDYVNRLALVTFDVKNSEMPTCVKSLILAAKRTKAAKMAGAEEDVDDNSKIVSSASFADTIFELFGWDLNFMANQPIDNDDVETAIETTEPEAKDVGEGDFFNAF